jgi:hypothetical protein
MPMQLSAGSSSTAGIALPVVWHMSKSRLDQYMVMHTTLCVMSYILLPCLSVHVGGRGQVRVYTLRCSGDVLHLQ